MAKASLGCRDVLTTEGEYWAKPFIPGFLAPTLSCVLSLPHTHLWALHSLPLIHRKVLEAPVSHKCPFSVMTPKERGILFLLSRYMLRRREDDSQPVPKGFSACRETGQAQSHQTPKYSMIFHWLHDR